MRHGFRSGGIYYDANFNRHASTLSPSFPPPPSMSSSQDTIMSEPGDLPLTPLTESQIEDIVDLTTATLSYEPEIIKGKSPMGTQLKLWHVNPSNVCLELCKSQLKIPPLSLNKADI